LEKSLSFKKKEGKIIEKTKKTREKITFLTFMDCYTLHGMNVLYEEARKCYVNTSTSKAQGVRITPEYVGPLPSTKRERHPRKCKKEAFNYKTNTSLPSNFMKFEDKNCSLHSKRIVQKSITDYLSITD
jgi:hypothetical protein